MQRVVRESNAIVGTCAECKKDGAILVATADLEHESRLVCVKCRQAMERKARRTAR